MDKTECRFGRVEEGIGHGDQQPSLISHDPSLLGVRSAGRDLHHDVEDYKMVPDSWGIILDNRKSRKEIS